MIKLKTFPFNPFQMNTYLLWDETHDAIVIDAGMMSDQEKDVFMTTIKTENLNLVASYHTHCHIDHIVGDAYIRDQFGLLPSVHPKGEFLLDRAMEQAQMFGFEMNEVVRPGKHLREGEEVCFGHSVLKVLYTPGHADGSVCFYNEEGKFVVVGDVLFRDGIGRTDLPSGDFDVLAEHIRNKLYTLAEEVVVYPGHGPATTIGYERLNNPYVRVR